jgi:nicotinamide-nucleotide amidase
MDSELIALSQRVGLALRERKLSLATAESCTGGWVAQVITHTAGSSEWFDRGFITYSNEAKIAMIGVRPETLATCGAVSEETASEMAVGALECSNARIALSITGIAGPTGGSPGKPVGTVCFGWCSRGGSAEIDRRLFAGNREEIRRQAVLYALEGLLQRTK